VGELAVVGQQDQAGRVRVQPADREQAKGAADQADDGRASLRIARRRDDARRLVDRVDDASDRVVANAPAVERDLVARLDPARRVEDRLATNPDPP